MTVQALVYRGPHQLELQSRPVQQLRAGEVRVKVTSVGVCGTDVRIVKGAHKAYTGVDNRVPGHEIVGRVSEIAPGTTSTAAVGDTVFVAPNLGCGACAFCLRGNENLCARTEALGITLDGGFAQQVVIPAAAVANGNLIPLDPQLRPDTATLLEPLACVVRGQDKVAVARGDRVMVAGCGPIGLLHIALARARGAGLIIASDRSPIRRAAAQRAGADVAVDWGTTDPERRGRRRDRTARRRRRHRRRARARPAGGGLADGGAPGPGPAVRRPAEDAIPHRARHQPHPLQGAGADRNDRVDAVGLPAGGHCSWSSSCPIWTGWSPTSSPWTRRCRRSPGLKIDPH